MEQLKLDYSLRDQRGRIFDALQLRIRVSAWVTRGNELDPKPCIAGAKCEESNMQLDNQNDRRQRYGREVMKYEYGPNISWLQASQYKYVPI